MAAGHRHAQHRHRGLRGQHAWQMGRAARPGNDGAQAARRRALGIGEHVVRHPVGRDHLRLMRNVKRLQYLYRMLQGVPVGTGTHHHANER